ncbi:MAG: hypothetical protein NTZ39_03080 [Methanoregula sp.]|nr:hypothetical protein [Methanoregula sp.]
MAIFPIRGNNCYSTISIFERKNSILEIISAGVRIAITLTTNIRAFILMSVGL